jgi:glucose-1-phosphate thymidylyltransferase
MKAILLAGGSGSRLFPITHAVSKQLLPVYDKPAIYYPLSNLMLGGMREILIISTPRDVPRIQELLGDGSQLGLKISYMVQPKPEGIAQAFILAKDFIGDSPVCLILGDNLFYGRELPQLLESYSGLKTGAAIMAYRVSDPSQFGVVEIDSQGRATRLEEKPKVAFSNYAVTGLYFYDNQVVKMAENLKPSARGELEITDLNRKYMELGQLKVEILGRGSAWLDLGTPDGLLSSSIFVQTLEKRQGLKIACLEEIAYFKRFIDRAQLQKLAENSSKSDYGQYLFQVMKELPG